MRRITRSRRGRRIVWIACLLLSAGAVSGWVGATIWLPAHVSRVSGRAGVPRGACLHCHRTVGPPPVQGAVTDPAYLSPEGLAVSPDGASLFVAAGGANRLLVVDLSRLAVVRSVAIPGSPHGVAVSADGARLAVSVANADRVLVFDAATLDLLHTIESGAEPRGLAVSADGRRIFVANAAAGDVTIADPGSSAPAMRLAAGTEPHAVALSRNGERVVVTSLRARPGPPRTVPAAEITLLDAKSGRVLERRRLVSGHLSEGVAISSDGSFALASLVQVRNLLPITQVARGAVMTSAIAFLETRPGGRTVQFPLAEVNAFFADPSGVALTPDDRTAFVAHGGAAVVTALNVASLREIVRDGDPEEIASLADDLGASARYVRARIPTRANPRALALSPDGSRLYVAERLADSVAVVDTETLEPIARIALGGPVESTAERRGERVFHDASRTFQGQFSCRSCHPGGHTDGLVWDFDIDGIGRNLVETRSLRGIRDTAPFKWNGKNPDLATQCGPRFARVLTRSDPFTPRQLEDLVAFLESLPVPPKRLAGEFAAARERGREIFFRERTNSGAEIPVALRCDTCHRPPLFTDRLMSDVGTGGTFDTPHLIDVRSSAPYLHDGRSATLEEIWTVHGVTDEHGVASDLSKLQLNDLVIYLRSL